ncbi:NAD(P)/FAD-dependent oxidoreductase [Phenylobacterium montanum]|uniref:FAD-dependent oxidoreductase n=1 Tax=Phenylobacterium montanum TaxID=2823693 RepID=A0A975G1Q0_9CAUL|nr:FAD-dependent oxidoreductase [Caulobacter sp. S6]QUD88943.1 FAD-dependent oxidoreductase [Caulobacter sp. S6]
MKIAVIGAGISGLGAAYALKDHHQVTIFEKDARLGGHANPVTVDYDGQAIDVDTGFIVYNVRNYPNLLGLFEHLGVESVPTDMSFAFAGRGVEWSSNFPGGVFAQKRNLVSPRFLAMLADIRRFNRQALADLEAGVLCDLTLGGYLRLGGYGPAFEQNYLLPMGAAIWSTSEAGVEAAPAESFVRFFANHNLLQMIQPSWRTVMGTSRAYLDPLTRRLTAGTQVRPGAVEVNRTAAGVLVRSRDGSTDLFDQVIFACHSDQALALLTDADQEEHAFLGAIRYAPNRAYLHRDPALMPRRRAAWGAWNYIYSQGACPGSVTYWMNRLQHIDPARPLFVSLNPESAPDERLTFAAFDYDHPQFDTPSLAAQRQFGRIQGRGGVWYAGAWLGHGFHEDGLTAGLRAALALGGEVPWRFVDHRIEGGPLPGLDQAQPERRVA